MSFLNRPYFREEEAAHSFLEGILWPGGSECPHCGVVGTAYKIAANPAKRVRYGLWKCRDCRKQFTVKVGTVAAFKAQKNAARKIRGTGARVRRRRKRSCLRYEGQGDLFD